MTIVVTKHKNMRITCLICILLFTSALVSAQTDRDRTKQFNIRKGIALEGYDPVSYFDDGPVEGNESFRTVYGGIVYQFSSQKNLNRFKAAPEKYEPAYGGWCAYAMGDTGEKVKIDPETYTILDGKLFLFYNFWGNNTLTDWKKNEKKLKESADRNWRNLVQ